MKELDKAYDPKKYEDEMYARWEKSGFFNPDTCIEKGVTQKDADPFTIILPPPNTTGTLHIGHAMYVIEDVMIRYHRMKGDRTLWLPGTDHAAIATNAKVERQLNETGVTRHELGREKFVKKIEDFITQSQGTIKMQLRKMGFSLDWSREAYTLDDTRGEAVVAAFKRMYDDGLIYRGIRVVNWDPVAQTTIADDEVVYKEGQAELYTFYYSKDIPIPIATTRPETKVGDTAIAVHPKGKWKTYIGKTFEVSDFVGTSLSLQVIGDENVDDSFGTGALGVTPAHSAIDADMAMRHKLAIKEVINEDGCMTENAGMVAGKPTLEARKEIVAWLKKHELLEGQETITQNLSTSERTGAPIEPLPKKQWFIDVNKEFAFVPSAHAPIAGVKKGQKVTLKKLMRHVVETDQITIVPTRFNKIYYHWIDNLRDWNISRQIWFGHRIPVWYKGDDVHCDTKPPKGSGWEQDPDVLDTWFSAGLWTFSALGWPNETDDLKTYHPTSVLETGYDILPFWVARMILFSTYLRGEVPFETVYLHGLVRDDQGRKMSKSLDNIIDPLDVADKFGTDAVRLALLLGTSPGQDKNLSEEKIESFRNFTNKLWNISRFVLMNITAPQQDIAEGDCAPNTLADQWVLARLATVTAEVTKKIEQYEFSAAGDLLQEFTWNEFADWYVEIAKIEGDSSADSGQKSKSAILNYVLNTVLKLWHPYMPFVTEAIWQEVYGDDAMLMVAQWPESEGGNQKSVIRDFGVLQQVIGAVRVLRNDYKISPKKTLQVGVLAKKHKTLLEEQQTLIEALARAEYSGRKPGGSSAHIALAGIDVYVDLEGVVDFKKERERIEKEIASVEPYVKSQETKFKNKKFVDNAPKEVVEQEKQKLTDAEAKLTQLKKQLDSLSA